MFLIRQWVERLRSHILFVPGLITVTLVGLAWLLVKVERWVDDLPAWVQSTIFAGGPEAAWEILSAIATSIVTLTGVTFSVTIVALALRSQQFGPRLLRNFTRRTLNQVVLGVFIGTITYALMILRLIRGEEPEYVPYLAVSVAVLLTLLCLALFVVFIDRIVDSIQSTTVIAEAAAETRSSIRRQFKTPDEDREHRDAGVPSPIVADAEPVDRQTDGSVAVVSKREGYTQGIDTDRLLDIACDCDLRIDLQFTVGDFVGERTVVARLVPATNVADDTADRVRSAINVGVHRSIVQDIGFGFRQIVDVAAFALSTGVNDPITATTCLDHLGALLAEVALCDPILDEIRDESGTLRVRMQPPTFRTLAELAFTDIRRYGEGDFAVTERLAQVVGELATLLVREEDRQVLERELWKVARSAERGIDDPADLERINRALQAAAKALDRDWLPVRPVADPGPERLS